MTAVKIFCIYLAEAFALGCACGWAEVSLHQRPAMCVALICGAIMGLTVGVAHYTVILPSTNCPTDEASHG